MKERGWRGWGGRLFWKLFVLWKLVGKFSLPHLEKAGWVPLLQHALSIFSFIQTQTAAPSSSSPCLWHFFLWGSFSTGTEWCGGHDPRFSWIQDWEPTLGSVLLRGKARNGSLSWFVLIFLQRGRLTFFFFFKPSLAFENPCSIQSGQSRLYCSFGYYSTVPALLHRLFKCHRLLY